MMLTHNIIQKDYLANLEPNLKNKWKSSNSYHIIRQLGEKYILPSGLKV